MRADMMELGDRIAEQAAHLDAAMFRLLADLRAFDAAGGWYQAGARSCAHWLSWRVGWDLGTAREHVRVARRLGELPKVGAELEKGALSYSKVRAITRVATAATEDCLVLFARKTTAAQMEKICRQYATVQRLATKGAEADRSRRHVARRDLSDGMVRIEAVLHPDEAALVWTAIERTARDGSAEPTARFDRADGLVAMSSAVVRGERMERTPVEIIMTVPLAALAADAAPTENPVDQLGCFADGGHVSAEGARRLGCDAGVVVVVTDEAGGPLSVGRKTRTIPAPIKRALLLRDQTCRFPGCTNRVFLDGHHLQHWADGGETSLDNLVTTCSHHHRFLHEHGYRVELVDGQPVFYNPHGVVVHATPPRLQLGNSSWEYVRALNEALEITPRTGQCEWDGHPVNYGYVLRDLHYFATHAPSTG